MDGITRDRKNRINASPAGGRADYIRGRATRRRAFQLHIMPAAAAEDIKTAFIKHAKKRRSAAAARSICGGAQNAPESP